MKFKFLTGDINWKTYGGKFISKKLNNGDFDYWLVLDVINWHDATGEEDAPKYNVSIQAVSPQQAGDESLQHAFSCCGIEPEYQNDPFVQVEALSDYGVFAQLWNKSGDNIKALMQEARKESAMIESLFGLYMDAPENRAGSNGWDLIAGNLTFRF